MANAFVFIPSTLAAQSPQEAIAPSRKSALCTSLVSLLLHRDKQIGHVVSGEPQVTELGRFSA